MKKIVMKDYCKIVAYKENAYGDVYQYTDATVPCLFNFGYGIADINHVTVENSDATAYLDIDDQFVQENMMRLEGMYFIINRYGEDLTYIIQKSTVGRTLLLDNVDNNVFLNLRKAILPDA